MKILRTKIFFNYKEMADLVGGGETGEKFAKSVRATRDEAAELIRNNRRSIERPAKKVIKKLEELPESVRNSKDISEGIKKLKNSIESSQKRNRKIADRFSRESIISDYVTARAKNVPKAKAKLEKHFKKIRNIGLAGAAVGLGLAGAAGYSAHKDHKEKKKKREEIWKDGDSKKK